MHNLTNEIDKFYDNYNGASDLRTPEEKAKDFSQEEFVASANPVNWQEKQDKDWRVFPVLNQFYTLKCVAFTTAKLAMINFWLKTKEYLHFSPNSIYDYRVNKPSGGMIGDDAFGIWKDKGISLEAVAKSNQVQETEPIDLDLFSKEVAKGFKLGNYITIPEKDFDRVASTIQTTGKGVMVWFYFTSREWSRDIPRVMDNLANPYVAEASRHSVTAVDFGLINGVEYLRIEDSAHFGGKNIRYITREFFNARNFLTKYPMNFNYEDPIVNPPTPPTYQFTLTMRLGFNNPEVKELQLRLQSLGFFPNNVSTTTYFGNVTRTAVIAYQNSKGLTADGIVGALTRAKLNVV
jgi:hypothetical protein